MKSFSPLLALIGLFLVCELTEASPARYDQRQTGDVNVQIHLKDVQVVALLDTELLDDYTDYNYAYDYTDFTIKPIVQSTTKSANLTTTVKPWTTWPTHPSNSSSSSAAQVNVNSTMSLSLSNSSTVKPWTTHPSNSSSISTVQVNVNSTTSSSSSNSTATEAEKVSTTPTNLFNNTSTAFQALSNTTMNEEFDLLAMDRKELSWKTPQKRCRSGYSLNGKGRCRRTLRRRLSLLPLAMNLVPKMTGHGISKDLRVASWTTTRD